MADNHKLSLHLRRTRILVLLFAAVALMVFAVTSYLNYVAAFKQMRSHLGEMANARSHMIEAVLDFDQKEYADFPGGSLAATMSQIRQAHRLAPGFGRTGEFVIAERRGEFIEFMVDHRFLELEAHRPIAWDSELAQPMRLALKGEQGTVVGLDYRNVRVLAGYAPIDRYELGIVAKVDISEIRRPFLETATIVAVFSFMIIALGTYTFISITSPVLKDLVDSERRLEEAQKIANMGNWEWEIESGAIFWSDQIYRIFGLSPREFEPTYEKFLEAVYPSDRDLVTAAVETAVRDPNNAYSVDHRLVHPDGTVRSVHEVGHVERRDDGLPLRMVGVVVDVTERKATQQAITLFEKVIHSIKESVFVVDLKGRVLDCNRAFEKTTGYVSSEVIGKRVKFGRCGMNNISKLRQIFASLRTNGAWDGELWDQKKNGDYYPVELSVTSLHDEAGRPTHCVAVFRDISEDRKNKSELENLAFFDPLTGLPNRRKITRILQERINSIRDSSARIGVCLFDLDDFKLLNTTLGSALGDEVIKSFAARVGQHQHSGDVFGRYGGDEFVLLLNGNGEQWEIASELNALFAEFLQPYQIGTSELFVGVSAGVAQYPADGIDPATLLANAELALESFRAVESRGFRFFSAPMMNDARKRREIEAQIREGLGTHEFSVFYQPKLDLASGRLVGAEALVRWIRHDGSIISPADFIPIAETSGLIVQLGNRVLEQAVSMAAKLNDAHDGTMQIAVNLSAREFVEKDLATHIMKKIEAGGLSPELIEFEVTESSAVIGMDHVIKILSALRDFGCSIAVDDFGTGYSSLSYLKCFPLDTLKVDRSFVTDVNDNESDAEMARAIVSMGKSLGLKIVAEGVETREQMEFFAKLGCDQIQGYLISKPLSEEDFLEFIKTYTPGEALST